MSVKIMSENVNTIRSRVKFSWKFEDELQATIDVVEEEIENELHKYFGVWSILSGKNNIKIRINDEEKNIQRIVNCVFRYNNTDEKYWNVDIELASSQLSKKPNIKHIWKFKVLDRKNIVENIMEYLIEWINEIY